MYWELEIHLDPYIPETLQVSLLIFRACTGGYWGCHQADQEFSVNPKSLVLPDCVPYPWNQWKKPNFAKLLYLCFISIFPSNWVLCTLATRQNSESHPNSFVHSKRSQQCFTECYRNYLPEFCLCIYEPIALLARGTVVEHFSCFSSLFACFTGYFFSYMSFSSHMDYVYFHISRVDAANSWLTHIINGWKRPLLSLNVPGEEDLQEENSGNSKWWAYLFVFFIYHIFLWVYSSSNHGRWSSFYQFAP